MASLKSLTLIFLLQPLLAAIFSITPIHCFKSLHQDQENLMQFACKDTTDSELCLRYLRAEPRSRDAVDLAELALIMVRAMKAKATRAYSRIHVLLEDKQIGSDLNQKNALRNCASRYNAILVADAPEAREALERGNARMALEGARDAAIGATRCEREFPAGRSLLTAENSAVHDVAAITASMVMKLL
ncbi:cell wall / vacuolar inhibitor of fructosidase 1-like [Senna tora]|uniref:Cell wall / vacuolar inhibitor of fructosidase 1-like n=1 Tax=Senna tora TaxID=362788 RepID=A0A834SMZ7_9FABA|nr:cell wall / vacuolar inhibitor of fructosidase 1-like [Senna tora]